MEYKRKDLGYYNLHMIKTDKFKTITFKIVFREEVLKNKITIRNLLVDNLIFSSLKYPSKKILVRKTQDLYGASLFGLNKRLGNHMITEFTLSILNPKYTEKGMMSESLDFFHEIIFNPNVKNGKFDSEIFDINYRNIKNDINSLKEDPDALTQALLKEAMDKNSPFSYRVMGYMKDLKLIDEKSLYEYYKHMLSTNVIDFYVVGDINFKEIEKIVKDTFNFITTKNITTELAIRYENPRNKEQVIVKDTNFNQSKLAIGCSLEELSLKEKKYILPIYNIILGSSPKSKFFTNIREKNSLCYTINSSFRRIDNLLYIGAGISFKNNKKTVSLIKKEMNDMKKGLFNKSDIDSAKELYISMIKDIEEYPNSICDYYFGLDYLGIDSIEKQLVKIKEVSKEEILEVAKKVKIDTIYTLREGVNNG